MWFNANLSIDLLSLTCGLMQINLSIDLLAHLTQKLMGELIVYQ